ncbi:MAG: TrbC/VirB2 family protein [Patescibacteria group bacterium]
MNSGLLATVFTTAALENPIKADTFKALAETVTNVMIAIGIPVAAIFIIYAGFLFVSARGNEEQIKTAKTTFYWTILGVALLVGAKIIAAALQTTITGLGE